MDLILMRHGIAEERQVFAKKNLEDHLRPLTLKGRKKIQKISIQLTEWFEHADLIVSSPFVRARQTAEVVSQIFFDTKVVEAAELVPSSPPQAFKRWLRAHADQHQRIIVVGHEPQLSVFATFLITGEVEPILELKKGGVLCLKVASFKNIAAGTARLTWLLQPHQILG
ncbi:MAG: phosphohistidine phosphatase SixA [Bdellovibrionaceae bacterium]|nr:phosphohistidine phosphatase SixA [Pseudobdellovibrionaceae bacterium]